MLYRAIQKSQKNLKFNNWKGTVSCAMWFSQKCTKMGSFFQYWRILQPNLWLNVYKLQKQLKAMPPAFAGWKIHFFAHICENCIRLQSQLFILLNFDFFCDFWIMPLHVFFFLHMYFISWSIILKVSKVGQQNYCNCQTTFCTENSGFTQHKLCLHTRKVHTTMHFDSFHLRFIHPWGMKRTIKTL